MIRHVGKSMQNQLIDFQFPQDLQLRAGDFRIYVVLVNVAAGIYNVILRLTHISIIKQAIQRIFRTVETILCAVGFLRHIQPHFELVVSANQARKKSFICNHATPPQPAFAMPRSSRDN